MTTPITFELAKLLKEKGYDKKCYKYFHSNFGKEYEYTLKGSDGELCTNWNIEKDYPQDFISAPTIATVIMWLYEKHGIWVNVSITIQKEYFYQCIDITGKKDPTKNNYPSRICKAGNYYNSPTEAYSAAIEYTLNNLI